MFPPFNRFRSSAPRAAQVLRSPWTHPAFGWPYRCLIAAGLTVVPLTGCDSGGGGDDSGAVQTTAMTSSGPSETSSASGPSETSGASDTSGTSGASDPSGTSDGTISASGATGGSTGGVRGESSGTSSGGEGVRPDCSEFLRSGATLIPAVGLAAFVSDLPDERGEGLLLEFGSAAPQSCFGVGAAPCATVGQEVPVELFSISLPVLESYSGGFRISPLASGDFEGSGGHLETDAVEPQCSGTGTSSTINATLDIWSEGFSVADGSLIELQGYLCDWEDPEVVWSFEVQVC